MKITQAICIIIASITISGCSSMSGNDDSSVKTLSVSSLWTLGKYCNKWEKVDIQNEKSAGFILTGTLSSNYQCVATLIQGKGTPDYVYYSFSDKQARFLFLRKNIYAELVTSDGNLVEKDLDDLVVFRPSMGPRSKVKSDYISAVISEYERRLEDVARSNYRATHYEKDGVESKTIYVGEKLVPIVALQQRLKILENEKRQALIDEKEKEKGAVEDDKLLESRFYSEFVSSGDKSWRWKYSKDDPLSLQSVLKFAESKANSKVAKLIAQNGYPDFVGVSNPLNSVENLPGFSLIWLSSNKVVSIRKFAVNNDYSVTETLWKDGKDLGRITLDSWWKDNYSPEAVVPPRLLDAFLKSVATVEQNKKEALNTHLESHKEELAVLRSKGASQTNNTLVLKSLFYLGMPITDIPVILDIVLKMTQDDPKLSIVSNKIEDPKVGAFAYASANGNVYQLLFTRKLVDALYRSSGMEFERFVREFLNAHGLPEMSIDVVQAKRGPFFLGMQNNWIYLNEKQGYKLTFYGAIERMHTPPMEALQCELNTEPSGSLKIERIRKSKDLNFD